MRLMEAIIDANHRAVAGDANAGLHPGDFQDELPIVALTCVDPRLNPLLPSVLGVPADQFIWLRNAGNVVSGPVSSTMRSLALAIAVKGGKEVAIIGHTDCQVSKTTTMELIERLRASGVERHLLPDNLNEYFGIFSSVRQNVIKGTSIVRSSPLIGPKIPVHGLVVDIQTGKLEWLVNGYQAMETMSSQWNEVAKSAGQTVDALKNLVEFKIGEMKFPETKIGEALITKAEEKIGQAVTQGEEWFSKNVQRLEIVPPSAPAPAAPTPPPPKIPLPPPIRPRMTLRKGPK